MPKARCAFGASMLRLMDIGSARFRNPEIPERRSKHRRGSTYEGGMLPEDLSIACQELIVQLVDLARFIRRDIPPMQRSQRILSGLMIETVVDRPRLPMKRRGLCGDAAPCQEGQRRNQRAREDNFAGHG